MPGSTFVKPFETLLMQLRSGASAAQSNAAELALDIHDPKSSEELAALAAKHPHTYQRVLEGIRATRNGSNPNSPDHFSEIVEHVAQYRYGKPAHESPLQLRWHQNQCFINFHEMLERGQKWGWIQLPTGSGKTPLQIALASAVGKRTIILEPTLELVENALKEIQEYAPHLKATEFNGSVKDATGDVVVCTYQSLGCLLDHINKNDLDYEMVILDEAHEALSPLRRDLIHKLAQDKILVAATATPDYSNEKTVSAYYGECLYKMGLAEGVEYGLLAKPRSYVIATNVDLSDSERGLRAGSWEDLTGAELNRILKLEARRRVSINILKLPQFQKLPTLVSCYNVEDALQWEHDAQTAGIAARAVHGEMPFEVRKAIYEQFDTGEVQALAYVDLLKLGWNRPKATICMNLRDTESLVLATQRYGRVTRAHDEKEYAISFDFLDRNGELVGIVVPDLFKEDEKRTGRNVLDVQVTEEQRKKEEREYRAAADAISGVLTDDFEILYDIAEVPVIRRQQRKKKEEELILTPELVRSILVSGGFNRVYAENLETMEAFSRGKFVVNGELEGGDKLLRRFAAQEISNRRDHTDAVLLSKFFRFAYGNDFGESSKKNFLASLSAGVFKRFFAELGKRSPDAISMDEEIEFGINQKLSLVTIGEVFDRIFPDKKIPHLDDFGITQTIARITELRAHHETRTQQDLYAGWEQSRMLYEFGESGVLAACLIKELGRDATYERLASHTLRLAGCDIQGKTILEYYNISAQDNFVEFWNELVTTHKGLNIPPEPVLIASRISMSDAQAAVQKLASTPAERRDTLRFDVGHKSARIEVSHEELLAGLKQRSCFGENFELNDAGIQTLAEFAYGSKKTASAVIANCSHALNAAVVVTQYTPEEVLDSVPWIHVCDFDTLLKCVAETPFGSIRLGDLIKELEIYNPYDWKDWLRTRPNRNYQEIRARACETVYSDLLGRRVVFMNSDEVQLHEVQFGSGIKTNLYMFGKTVFQVQSHKEVPKIYDGIVNITFPNPVLHKGEGVIPEAKRLFKEFKKAALVSGIEIRRTSDLVAHAGLIVPETGRPFDYVIAEYCHRGGNFSYRPEYDDEHRRRGIEQFARMLRNA